MKLAISALIVLCVAVVATVLQPRPQPMSAATTNEWKRQLASDMPQTWHQIRERIKTDKATTCKVTHARVGFLHILQDAPNLWEDQGIKQAALQMNRE